MITFLRRLFRQEGRMHKRPFVTAVTVFAVFLLLAAFFFLGLGILRMSYDYPEVSTQAESSDVLSSGLGVNLSYIPSTNLLWDPSFENDYYENVFSVAEAKGDVVYLHSRPDDPYALTDTYKGGELRIMTYDEEGKMSQVVYAGIVDYQTDQLGVWKEIENETSGTYATKWLRSEGNYALALLQNGELITDITSSEPTRIEQASKDDPIADAAVHNAHFFAVTSAGTFYISSNGRAWETVSDAALKECDMLAVTALGRLGIACGRAGKILVCDGASISTPSRFTENSLYTAVSSDTRALLAGENGYVCTTVNGSVFRKLTSDELETKTSDKWILSAINGEEFVLVSENGMLAIGTCDEKSGKFSFVRYDVVLPSGLVPKQIALFPNGDVWALTENGYIYSFSRAADKWHQIFAEKDNQIDSMTRTSGENILICRSGNLYSASMYTKVTIDQAIGEVEIQNGDMCLLSAPVPSVDGNGRGAWEVFGESSTVQIVSGSPKAAGDKSLQLSSSLPDEEQAHFISQVISKDEISPMKEKVFYHIRLYLKQNNMEKEQVMVWISGLSEPIGTTFTDVSGNWREYSYTFAWPSEKGKVKEEDIRLNIGFYGSGEMLVDGVCLERETYSEQQIRPKLVDLLDDNSPEFLRLSNLGLGRLGTSISSNLPMIGNELLYAAQEGEMVSSGVVSLETTMRLVKQVDANPWLVIDSAFGSDEMEILLGYLCGGITDTYGKIRVDNGTALAWQKQFDRFVVEITDENGLFETDLQRRAYVDHMIEIIKGSEFYSDMKDRLFFVDGMRYDNGTMLSVADYHSSDLFLRNTGEERLSSVSDGEISSLLDSIYTDYIDAIPRNSSYMQDVKGEWISDLSISIVQNRVSENQIVSDEIPMNAAQLLEFLLYDLGDHTSFVSVDLPVSRISGDAKDDYLFAYDGDTLENRRIRSANAEVLLRTVGVVTKIAQGPRVETSWTAPLSRKKDDSYSIGLTSYAFASNGNIYLIVANPTTEQQQFLIDTDVAKDDITVKRYSSECKEIALASTRSILHRNERRYTLQAGQFCVAVIPVG